MVKIENMNVFDCLTSIDKNCMVELHLNDCEIHVGCPDDVLRHISYEDVGTNVRAMGINYDTKVVTLDCRKEEKEKEEKEEEEERMKRQMEEWAFQDWCDAEFMRTHSL